MSKYSTFLDEIINNIHCYNLYFAIIKLANIAKLCGISEKTFKVDVNAIKQHLLCAGLQNDSKLLDINDGLQAFTDNSFSVYTSDFIDKLIRDFY